MTLDRRDLVLLVICAVGCAPTPSRSYCQALCDWAVTCQSTVRGVNPEALTQECLAAAKAIDPTCAAAEAGEIERAARDTLETCVAEIDGLADKLTCAAFVGTFDEIGAGAAPAACAAEGPDAAATFAAARGATTESGDDLCARFTDAICQQTEQCLLGAGTTIPSGATAAIGGMPYAVCMERMALAFTAECFATDRWAQDDGFLTRNDEREAALACTPKLPRLDCGYLLTVPPLFPEECAGAFTAEDAQAIGETLVGLADEWTSAVP